MPPGPKGEKRPADAISNAMIAKIATGGKSTQARTVPTPPPWRSGGWAVRRGPLG